MNQPALPVNDRYRYTVTEANTFVHFPLAPGVVSCCLRLIALNKSTTNAQLYPLVLRSGETLPQTVAELEAMVVKANWDTAELVWPILIERDEQFYLYCDRPGIVVTFSVLSNVSPVPAVSQDASRRPAAYGVTLHPADSRNAISPEPAHSVVFDPSLSAGLTVRVDNRAEKDATFFLKLGGPDPLDDLDQQPTASTVPAGESVTLTLPAGTPGERLVFCSDTPGVTVTISNLTKFL